MKNIMLPGAGTAEKERNRNRKKSAKTACESKNTIHRLFCALTVLKVAAFGTELFFI